MSTSLYAQELMYHYRNPSNRGIVEDPDFSASDHSPSCGDRVSFTGKVQDGKLSHVAFMGSGCVLSLATASMLTEEILGKPLEEILQFSRENIIELIGVTLGPNRIKCAMLPLLVVREGLGQVQMLCKTEDQKS